MSARDDLISLFDAGGPHPLFSSEEVADDILCRHAHELATKIRSQQCPEEILAVELGWAAVWRRGVNDSANEIDSNLSRVDSTSVADTGRDQP